MWIRSNGGDAWSLLTSERILNNIFKTVLLFFVRVYAGLEFTCVLGMRSGMQLRALCLAS